LKARQSASNAACPAAGLTFHSVFDPKKLPTKPNEQLVTADATLARPAVVATTTVVRVFPSADKLPENHLRFYLHFSAPMNRGEAYAHLKLLDENGKEVARPF